MTVFIPEFYVTNRQGWFLAKVELKRTYDLPIKWVHDRKDATSFPRWIEADTFRLYLPPNSQSNATITDQNGDVWTPQRAKLANVYHSRVSQPIVPEQEL